MPTIPYVDSQGKRLPGVTTVISNLGWNTSALVWWANQEGLAGRNCRETVDKACDIGTLVHSCVEADIQGKPWPAVPDEYRDKVDNAMLGYLHWRDTVSFELVDTEISLVSDAHGFGGTMDLVSIAKQPILSDLKTSKGVYAEHKIQLAAYHWLWDRADRQFKDGQWQKWEPPCMIEGLALLQVGKEDGSFHYHFWNSLKDAWEIFFHLLQIHKLKKAVK